MTDCENRIIDYMRISVTDRCNLRCVYCMPQEGIAPQPHSEILSYEEIVRVCRAAARVGIRKIKLTGGEPLVRKGLERLIEQIKAIDGIEQVTMTTNGVLLAPKLPALCEAGLDAVNISLDTLDPQKFSALTRREGLAQTLEAVDCALEAGISVKINCVPLRELGEQQMIAMAALAKTRPIAVRFIELMPIGLGGRYESFSVKELRELLSLAYGTLTPFDGVCGNGPASYLCAEGFVGKIGFIGAISERFCEKCNRVRLTASGFLKLCLHYDRGIDLRLLLRAGISEEALAEQLRDAIAHKPTSHRFGEQVQGMDTHKMVQIGG